MKTIKEIENETPHSVTVTDNAIFETVEAIVVIVDNLDTEIEGDYKLEHIAKGTRLRLLACELQQSGVSPFRVGRKNAAFIPNYYMKYISGEIGKKVNISTDPIFE